LKVRSKCERGVCEIIILSQVALKQTLAESLNLSEKGHFYDIVTRFSNKSVI